MSLILGSPPAPTAPGTDVTSGPLTARVHGGFPGVLLRVVDAAISSVVVRRADVDEEIDVRSGSPLPLSTGEGWAYDHEAAPGGTYLYSVTIAGVTSSVLLTMPGWESYPRHVAWLKSAAAPELSRMVAIGRPQPVTRPTNSSVTPVVGGLSFGRHVGGGSRTWALTLYALSARERDHIDELLDAGEFLWQSRPGWESPTLRWLMPGQRQSEQIGGPGGKWAHRITVDVTEVARPYPGETSLRIPGWGWYESVAGLTDAAAYASAYPTTWDQLKAGVAGWTQ